MYLEYWFESIGFFLIFTKLLAYLVFRCLKFFTKFSVWYWLILTHFDSFQKVETHIHIGIIIIKKIVLLFVHTLAFIVSGWYRSSCAHLPNKEWKNRAKFHLIQLLPPGTLFYYFKFWVVSTSQQFPLLMFHFFNSRKLDVYLGWNKTLYIWFLSKQIPISLTYLRYKPIAGVLVSSGCCSKLP